MFGNFDIRQYAKPNSYHLTIISEPEPVCRKLENSPSPPKKMVEWGFWVLFVHQPSRGTFLALNKNSCFAQTSSTAVVDEQKKVPRTQTSSTTLSLNSLFVLPPLRWLGSRSALALVRQVGAQLAFELAEKRRSALRRTRCGWDEDGARTFSFNQAFIIHHPEVSGSGTSGNQGLRMMRRIFDLLTLDSWLRLARVE